jgi:hypothetical protein
VGYLNVEINKSLRENLVGGLHPPMVSLRHGEAEVQERARPAAAPGKSMGLEKVRVNKLNFFSCMDANELGWEVMPYNFETKLRHKYSDH